MTSPAAPLRELAQQGHLSTHQFMDQATLDWITANRPTLAPAASLPYPLLLLVPEAAWFVEARGVDSIHGVRHGARVCLLASLLAQEHKLSHDDTVALCAAAAVHDCRRRDDRADPGHGHRAAHWFARNNATVLAVGGWHTSAAALAKAAVAIGLHDVPHHVFSPKEQRAYQTARLPVDLLKAADCLDRYRLPLTRWWPDPSYLRITVPSWLHAVAFDLVVRSEQARLDGATHHDALTHALALLGHDQ
ncbi:hypothetical protein ABT061_32975 [Streptosporangium sp. NPDC002544]|uniref:hypothetical protein n=1 Tax=Streptosporangium sp. NPDC002544 TaxID=3154538 RepID=UPI00332861CD